MGYVASLFAATIYKYQGNNLEKKETKASCGISYQLRYIIV